MASAGYRKRVSPRTGRVSYQVWWVADDGSQGARTVDTTDEAKDLAAERRLELRRGTWQGRRRGRLPFSTWAAEWWQLWAADPDHSPYTLEMAESRLRNHLHPFFGRRPVEEITPKVVRQWQQQLAGRVGYDTVVACRSLLLRILQFATDEGAIEANPVRKVPPPKRRADPEQVFAEVKRRALTPEEAGRLLACFPLFWWDHVTTPARHRPALRRAGRAAPPPRPPRPARARPPGRPHQLPGRPVRQRLQAPPQERCRHPRGAAGPRGGRGDPPPAPTRQRPRPLGVHRLRRRAGSAQGTRTVLSRHNFYRTHHGAVAKLADPATSLRPTAARVLKVLRGDGPLTPDQLAAHLAGHGRALRPATVQRALGELHAARLATADGDRLAGRWSALPPPQDPLLDAVDLHGAHDFRHTFATWLEDAGIPARVIDEVMGHEATRRAGQQHGSAIGAHYRHTTAETAARIAAAVQQRLTVVLQVAEQTLEARASRATPLVL